MIREYSRSKGVVDEISDVLGSQIYAQSYVFPALRDAVLTRFSTQILPVSRYYMRLAQKVVVDFEPNPLDGNKFYVDEKRKFFAKENIVFVPVFIGELLTKEQFKARVEEETRLLIQTRQEALEDAALGAVDDESKLDAETLAAIDKETHTRVAELRLTKHLFGAALAHTIARVKREVVLEVLKERMNHGRTRTFGSGSDTTFAAR